MYIINNVVCFNDNTYHIHIHIYIYFIILLLYVKFRIIIIRAKHSYITFVNRSPERIAKIESPLNIKCVDLTTSTAHLKWTAPLIDENISEYLVERKDICYDAWVPIGRTVKTEMVVKDLTKDHDYSFRVASANRDSQSTFSTLPKPIRIASPYGSYLCITVRDCRLIIGTVINANIFK